MDKYAGNIMILDAEGNVMHDRDLSSDEIIGELLAERDRMLVKIGEAELSKMRDPGAHDSCTNCGTPLAPGEKCGCEDQVSGKDTVPAIDLNEDTIKAVLPETAFKFEKHVPEKKGAKACKYCGVPGHMQKTCPKKRVEDRDLEVDEDVPEDGTVLGMGLLEGDDLDEAVSDAKEEFESKEPVHEFNAEKKGAMTGIEFMKVKTMKADGFNSVQIASAIRHNIREVNKAWACGTHSEYIKNRERDV